MSIHSVRSLALVLFSLLALITGSASANKKKITQAMVVSFQGTVQFFPANEVTDGKGYITYDGKKQLNRKVKVGLILNPGDILRTGEQAKVKIIYESGDVFILGPASAFRMPAPSEPKQGKSGVSSELLYGKVRGMIDKDGPMSGLKMVTKTLVAGVRGTDLYVSYNPSSSASQIHVLRGEVESTEMKPNGQPAASAFVRTGQKAVLEKSADSASGAAMKVQPSTQQELEGIQSDTKTEMVKNDSLSEEEKKKIEDLIKTAKKQILNDIKTTTPEIYEKIQGQNLGDLEQITSQVVTNLKEVAPKGSGKPKMSDFNSDKEVYDKFFRPKEDNSN